MLISRLIDKNFSEYEDEMMYSVLMDEDELRLYSEFLEEREYARVPFKGYSKASSRAAKKAFQTRWRQDVIKGAGEKLPQRYIAENFKTVPNTEYAKEVKTAANKILNAGKRDLKTIDGKINMKATLAGDRELVRALDVERAPGQRKIKIRDHNRNQNLMDEVTWQFGDRYGGYNKRIF